MSSTRPSGTGEEILAGPHNWNEAQRGICFDVPNAEMVDILLTFQCNAACEHCITESNPSRREWLERGEVFQILDSGIRFGKRYVGFSGGEPFLRRSLLLQFVRRAKELGYIVCADTNAYWGRTAAAARKTVSLLKSAGLDGLFPSADPYHMPYVPLDSVINVVRACSDLDLPCEVNFAPGPDPEVNERILAALDLRKHGFFNDGIALTGNDVTSLLPIYPQRRPGELNDVGSMHVAVSPRGDFYGNCDVSYKGDDFVGTPLYLGNLRSEPVAALFERERSSPLLRLLQQVSPAEAHARLTTHPSVGALYRGRLALSTFYSATAYWSLLLHARELAPVVQVLSDWGRELEPSA